MYVYIHIYECIFTYVHIYTYMYQWIRQIRLLSCFCTSLVLKAIVSTIRIENLKIVFFKTTDDTSQHLHACWEGAPYFYLVCVAYEEFVTQLHLKFVTRLYGELVPSHFFLHIRRVHGS